MNKLIQLSGIKDFEYDTYVDLFDTFQGARITSLQPFTNVVSYFIDSGSPVEAVGASILNDLRRLKK